MRKVEKQCAIAPGIMLRLFKLPGKDGMMSSYPTQWAVGFERKNGDYASQRFIEGWQEDYSAALAVYNFWSTFLA